MDNFTTFGVTFEEAMINLENVLVRCQEHILALNSEKKIHAHVGRLVLGHFISAIGIQVDLAKIEVIQTFPIPSKSKDVRYFLGHVGYYRCFI